MKIAKYIKDVSARYIGNARLYKLHPPLNKQKYVVASAIIIKDYNQITCVFASDKNGNILNWKELQGTTYDIFDCDKAIENAGYTIMLNDEEVKK